jgi:hypothetical protein
MGPPTDSDDYWITKLPEMIQEYGLRDVEYIKREPNKEM